jgi:hypothetical protein
MTENRKWKKEEMVRFRGELDAGVTWMRLGPAVEGWLKRPALHERRKR